MIKKTLLLLGYLCTMWSGVAFGEEPISSPLQDFVAAVYADYAAESFDAVYAVMYPSIAESVPEGDYVKFQRQHFERLQLELRDIEVGEVSEGPKLARSLRQWLPDDKDLKVYGVEISYKVSFVRGMRFDQTIAKTVYVVLGDPQSPQKALYLLWDPSSMEEEETAHGSD